jgi:hypothetical protein
MNMGVAIVVFEAATIVVVARIVVRFFAMEEIII